MELDEITIDASGAGGQMVHTADTVLPWLVLCEGRSRFLVDCMTDHLIAQRDLLNHWCGPVVRVNPMPDGIHEVVVDGLHVPPKEQRFPLRSKAVIFHGGPGAGKSRFSRAAAVASGAVRVAVGEHLREHIRAAHGFRKRIALGIESGQPAPERLVRRLVAKRLALPNASYRGILLDGFPRSVGQARWLIHALREHGITRILVVVLSDGAEPGALRGATTRPAREGRLDDRANVIALRWQRHLATSGPVLAFLRKRCVELVEIPTSGKTKFEILDQIARRLGLCDPAELHDILARGVLPYLRDPDLSREERSAACRLAAQLAERTGRT